MPLPILRPVLTFPSRSRKGRPKNGKVFRRNWATGEVQMHRFRLILQPISPRCCSRFWLLVEGLASALLSGNRESISQPDKSKYKLQTHEETNTNYRLGRRRSRWGRLLGPSPRARKSLRWFLLGRTLLRTFLWRLPRRLR
jgi:hypothetical protein